MAGSRESSADNKVGLTLSRNALDVPLAQHFGMAKWLLIYESDTAFEFVRNEELSGRGVVEVLQQRGCSDAVFSNIGQGALEHLKAAGIRGWYGAPDVPVRELIERLERGELRGAVEATEEGRQEHRHRER
jgi:predicted Fe-Mo cluster-binding NifX family protein